MLIVAALNGTRSRLECPKVPLTAEDLATEAKRAVDAGAGVVHVHARKKDGLPAFDLFIEDVVKAIRGKVDVPISISTQRTRSISLGTVTAIFDVLRELPDLASRWRSASTRWVTSRRSTTTRCCRRRRTSWPSWDRPTGAAPTGWRARRTTCCAWPMRAARPSPGSTS
jgi:uncharacterized protein (DUF849 family)